MELKGKGKYSKSKKLSEPSKPSDRSGIPKPLKIKCFKCKKNVVEVKYVVASKSGSKKSNGEYGVNPEANNPEFGKDKEARRKDKQICNSCLLALYHDKDKFGEVVKDRKKKKKLGVYIYTGIIE